jgi:hypothetical protein
MLCFRGFLSTRLNKVVDTMNTSEFRATDGQLNAVVRCHQEVYMKRTGSH